MPKAIEDCVKKIKGTNKRTGKPYTQSEKWAICTAMHNKKKDAAFEEETVAADPEIADKVENAMDECVRKMMSSGKAHNHQDAVAMCEAMMAKSNFDHEKLWFVVDKVLGG